MRFPGAEIEVEVVTAVVASRVDLSAGIRRHARRGRKHEE